MTQKQWFKRRGNRTFEISSGQQRHHWLFQQNHHYSKSDKLLSSKVDDDFDGYLETEVFYSQGSIYLSSVDSDSDQLRDIFYFYNSGTLVKGIKYYVNA